jgi:bisphosphoglycerate-independent phosphoglycerate mutase (AlkP superfamily)
MTSLANAIVDKAVDSAVNNINPAAVIPKSMGIFVDNEKIHLKQIGNNFIARHFDFRTKDREKKLHVVQLMSEYQGNFTTPVCYL